MLQNICLVSFVLIFAFFVWVLYLIYCVLFSNFRILSGYVLDVKVDEIIKKATIIGELQSFRKAKPGVDRVPEAMEKAIAISTDVFLQNGINPREYNLLSLVMLARYALGLKFKDQGGEQHGKSQRPTVQY